MSINVQSSNILDVHAFAVLIGLGATTVNPYLAENTIIEKSRKYGSDNNNYSEELIISWHSLYFQCVISFDSISCTLITQL